MGVHDYHLGHLPAGDARPLVQCEWARRRLDAGEHLPRRRLSDAEVGGARQVCCGHLMGSVDTRRPCLLRISPRTRWGSYPRAWLQVHGSTGTGNGPVRPDRGVPPKPPTI